MITIDVGFSDVQGQSGPNLLIRLGPTIRVFIDHVKAPQGVVLPPKEDGMVAGLIDTGALHSCIDVSLATQLKLPIVDKVKMGGASGLNEHPLYLAKIHIPDLQLEQYGGFAGVDLAGGGQVHRALLGRTFLQGLTMTYYGFTGQVLLIKSS